MRKKMLLVLVYPSGKGAAGRPAPSLRAACSSSSRCHDLRAGACWAVPQRQALGGGGWPDPIHLRALQAGRAGEKAAGISAGCFPGEEKHTKEIWVGWKCHSSLFKNPHLSRWALENSLHDSLFDFLFFFSIFALPPFSVKHTTSGKDHPLFFSLALRSLR